MHQIIWLVNHYHLFIAQDAIVRIIETPLDIENPIEPLILILDHIVETLTFFHKVGRVHYTHNHKISKLLNQTIIIVTLITLDHNQPITTEMKIALGNRCQETALEWYKNYVNSI